MLKTGLLAIGTIVSLSLSLNAQTEPKATPQAYKFAEFQTISVKELSAKMKAFNDELNKNPTAQGYIISYGTRNGIKARRAAIMKSITWRRYDGSRISFVEVPANKKSGR